MKLFAQIAASTVSATVLSTGSSLQWYLPSPTAQWQPLIMCLSVLLPGQSGHNGIPLFPQVNKFVGLGNTPYTDCTRNFNRLASACQISEQLILLVINFSHRVYASYRGSRIILPLLSSSTRARTSSWIRFRLCFLSALWIWILGK